MYASRLAGFAVIALAAGTVLLAGVEPAGAATNTLYVNNTVGANCSDAGTGTQAQPYCTIGVAVATVQPGQTIDITGTYFEDVTIAKSGTGGAPITLTHTGVGVATIDGLLVIDGQHDLSLQHLMFTQAGPTPLVRLHNSSAIHFTAVGSTWKSTGGGPSATFAGITDSDWTGGLVSGISLDAASSRVTLRRLRLVPVVATGGDIAADLGGMHNALLDSAALGWRGAGVKVEPGASDTLLVNDTAQSNTGFGFLSSGATRTTLSNDLATNNCGTGIRVDGASSGVSVENTIARFNGSDARNGCGTIPPDAVDIGVYGAAMGTTLLDYNEVESATTDHQYAWSTPMGLAAFRAASGQGAHDLDDAVVGESSGIDSANSAATGYPSTDEAGSARVDDPLIANTGAGPVSYADRGPREAQPSGPHPALSVNQGVDAMTVAASAAASTAGWTPIISYTFDFGDGTPPVSQTTPLATHTYVAPGAHLVTVKVTDAGGLSNQIDAGFRALKLLRVIGLIAQANGRYVTAEDGGARPLIANRTKLGAWERFDLYDTGPDGDAVDAAVVIRSEANGQFVGDWDSGIRAMTPQAIDTTLFHLVSNADGSMALRVDFATRYVTAQNAGAGWLYAGAMSVGPWEEFFPVEVANVSRSLNAHANGRYITAESMGTQPLIANRTAVGQWERFDIVGAGDGYVALYSHADNGFVTADSAGGAPLIANRTAIGAWERFQLIHNPDGSISLKAGANGRYVTAESAGGSPLIANRTAIGPWEEFTLG